MCLAGGPCYWWRSPALGQTLRPPTSLWCAADYLRSKGPHELLSPVHSSARDDHIPTRAVNARLQMFQQGVAGEPAVEYRLDCFNADAVQNSFVTGCQFYGSRRHAPVSPRDSCWMLRPAAPVQGHRVASQTSGIRQGGSASHTHAGEPRPTLTLIEGSDVLVADEVDRIRGRYGFDRAA